MTIGRGVAILLTMMERPEDISMCVIYGKSFSMPERETVIHEQGNLAFRAPLMGERCLDKFGNVCHGVVAKTNWETNGFPRLILSSVSTEMDFVLTQRFVAKLDKRLTDMWQTVYPAMVSKDYSYRTG